MARSLQHIAAAAILQPQAARKPAHGCHVSAARVFGFVSAQIKVLGSSDPFGPGYDRALAVLGDKLGAEQLAHLIVAGGAMSEDEAIAAARNVEAAVD